jgi:hypothetical protein
MTSGPNTSILDDFAYALRRVVRTILGVCLIAIILIVGLGLVGFAVLVAGFLWLGHKIGLIQDPPSVKFRQFQGRMAGRLIQAKLGKMGFGEPAGGNFSGAEPRPPSEPLGQATVQEVEVEAEIEAEEVVNAKELEDFHGSLEEFIRSKRGR